MTMIAPYHLYKDIPPAGTNKGSETPRNIINTNIFKVGYLFSKNKPVKDKAATGAAAAAATVESNETRKNYGS